MGHLSPRFDMTNSPKKWLGRVVRFSDTMAFVCFEHRQAEATFDRLEFERLCEYFSDARLRLDRNSSGQIYVRLRWREGGKTKQRSVARILENLAGNYDLNRRQVSYRNGNQLDLTPQNRIVSARGALRGDDSSFQETARRVWAANNSAQTHASAQGAKPSAASPLAPLQKPDGRDKRKRGAAGSE
jgi:hypothetical protein